MIKAYSDRFNSLKKMWNNVHYEFGNFQKNHEDVQKAQLKSSQGSLGKGEEGCW